MQRKPLYIIALLMALLIPTAIVAAAGSETVGNFRVDLVNSESGPADTTILTYAVTGVTDTKDLSHWVLGIGACLDHLVEPQSGSYSTVTDLDECSDGTYSCQLANYKVETGADPRLGIYGIKFEDGSPQLNEGKTHVFQIRVKEFAHLEEVEVGAKYGQNEHTGYVDGPVCGGTTAVSLASTNVDSAPLGTLLPMLLGLMIVLAGATLFVLRHVQLAAITE